MTPRPVRLQLSRKKGFNLQVHSLATNGLSAVNCARPSKWGNPFQVGKLKMFRNDDPPHDTIVFHPMSNDEVVASFRWLVEQPKRLDIVRELAGKNLACFCALDVACHCDVLLELANRPLVCEEVTP